MTVWTRGVAAMLGVAVWLAAGPAAALPELAGKPTDDKLGRPGEPGSGVPIEEQLRTVNRDALTAPLPLRPRDEKEAQAIEVMEELSARYKAAYDVTAHTIGQQLLLEGVNGRKALEQQYEREIREHQAKARKLRAQAVRRYEDFLQVHPADPAWTPEVMFRLAELHFEASTERLARQEEAWEKEVEAYQQALEDNPDAQPPPSPRPDYAEAIALYRGIVQRFPRFHLGDGSLYMMGTLLYEMEELDQSRQSYLALACANKHEPPLADGSNVITPVFKKGDYEDCTPFKEDSIYAAEAWLRIGEIHYDYDELAPALEAYAQVARDPQGDLYDEALVRMASTLYLMRDFPEAARRFDEFIRWADANRDKESETGAIALRELAVEYLAKTYIEDWNDNLAPLARLDREYAQRGKERHVPEIYAALGDLKAFETDFQAAISIWDKTLNRWPLAPAAPSIQDRILQAREMLQDKEGATQARDKLATNYLRGTEWFYANENDPDAIEAAMKLAEGALVATATDHHEKAQNLRAEGDEEGARREYEIAAKAYAAYLERFPDTESSYEYRYNYADSLYYSHNYVDAAKQYAEVRDSNIDNRLQEDAASGAVLALEAYVEDATRAGTLDRPPMPKEGVEGPFDQPNEIPPVFTALQTAYDRFVQVRPDSKQAASMMYLSGEISQRFHHFDEAEKRFSSVLDEHCEDNAAIRSGLAIIDGKVALQDLKGAQEWTEKLSGMGCGSGEEAAKFAGTLKTLGNAVRFKEATLLYEAGEFEAAADRYVALVDQAPDDPNADRALNNAAVAYENIGRFSSASQTYKRIYTAYPDSEFADDALQRSGLNHSRFFEYEEAVSAYLVLAENERYKDSELRENALWNAAGLLDNLQEYKRSAAMYQRFAEKTEDEAKGADALFRAANVLGKTSDQRATIAAYEQFLGKYGSDNKYADKAVESYLRIGQAWQGLDKRAKAEEYYRRTVEEFNRRGLKPNTEAADHPSEAQFLLAEYALNDVLAIKITGTGKKMEREAKLLTDRLVLASKEYDNVFPYRRLDWVLAAMYRRGYAFETYAISLRAAPVPKKLKEYSEAWFAYTDIVGKIAEQFETKAIGLYEETVKRAREYNMANEWTRAAVERLNIYKPEEYPLLRQPALDLQLEEKP
jgi:tetratricopeptide (TPR) repeat protein